MPGRAGAEPIVETVDVTIPSKAAYLSIGRLAAAAVAARHGFTYDEIEDLKIAVSEACSALLSARRAACRPITLRFVPEPNALAVLIETADTGLGPTALSSNGPPAADERVLGLFLMQCLVDEVSRLDRPGSVSLRLVKRRQERSSGGPSSAD